jgi:hypothetical protein
MRCPNCKLENPPTALLCDCGYSFETGLVQHSSKVSAGPKTKLFWILLPLVVGLFGPSLIIFYLEVFVGNVAPLEAVADILKRQFAHGHYLVMIALLGLIPFSLLSAICGHASRKTTTARLSCLGVGGLLGILCFMVPAHASVWYPLYAGQRMHSTAILAFLFIPFYCLFTLGIGMLLGWDIYTVGTDGSNLKRLTTTGTAGHPVWSPTAKCQGSR